MELVIRACEGGVYLANLIDDHIDSHQEEHKSNAKKFNSLDRVRDYFHSKAPNSVWLYHNVAYDEMIGLPSNESVVKQKLHWYQS